MCLSIHTQHKLVLMLLWHIKPRFNVSSKKNHSVHTFPKTRLLSDKGDNDFNDIGMTRLKGEFKPKDVNSDAFF